MVVKTIAWELKVVELCMCIVIPAEISLFFFKPGDSHFWAGVMATKKFFFPYGSFFIKNGSEIRFCEDRWLGTASLRKQFPALYNIFLGRYKSDTLA